MRLYIKTDWIFWVYEVFEQLLIKTLTKKSAPSCFLASEEDILLVTAYMMSEVKNYHVNVTIQGFLKKNQ